MTLRVLHVVSSNRWSGAAAPAFAEVEALREAGVDAHYAYVGAYKLERKIGPREYAHPIVDREQNPLSFANSVRRLRRLIRERGFDIIHAHLTYDHLMAHFAGRESRAAIARTFHSRRAIRSDFLTRRFIASAKVLCVINADLLDAAALRHREAAFTPPPLDTREFAPSGPNARSLYEIGPEETVFCAIGKLTEDRNFDGVLETFALLRSKAATAERLRLMIIGNGPHRGALQQRSQDLGIADHVVWAGYHQADLAEHYRASDVLLFAAQGSDEGHRAVLEAMGCGVIPVTYPLEGMRALTGNLAPDLIAAEGSPAGLAGRAAALLRSDRAAIRRAVVERSTEFSYARAAERLVEAYERQRAEGRGQRAEKLG